MTSIFSEQALTEARDALLRGEVIALPTDTVYGLAVNPALPGTSERIFAVKGRPDSVALPVLVADVNQARTLTDANLDALAAAFWPGPFSVVVSRSTEIAWSLGGDETTIGIRCPSHGRLRELLAVCGPLAVSSANRYGETPCQSVEDIEAVFGDEIGLVLDGGRCDGIPSTVVSLVGGEPEILREGPVSLDEIASVLGRSS